MSITMVNTNSSWHATYIKRKSEDSPNAAGKLAGYCSDCGLMRIVGEAECHCGCAGIVKDAPEPVEAIGKKVNDRF